MCVRLFEFFLLLIDYLTVSLFSSAGSVLIFVTKKANSEELAAKLKTKDFEGKAENLRGCLKLFIVWFSRFLLGLLGGGGGGGGVGRGVVPR